MSFRYSEWQRDGDLKMWETFGIQAVALKEEEEIKEAGSVGVSLRQGGSS